MRARRYRKGMRDSEVVAAIVAGDPAGLAEAYDRYATPLYSFCRTMLREPADAADAVQDTFVIAAPRLSGLRDPERLRSWLYAVARNECLRKLRSAGLQAPIDEVPDLTDEAADVTARVEEADLRALVRDALAGVVPAEREILELQLRQGLSAGEVADVLGVSRNHAHARLSRARDQLETSLGALVVARTGRQDCPDLDAMLQDWDGRLTVLLRKRVNRHLERCLVCAGRRRREVTPAMLLGIAPVAALPLALGALPTGLRDHVLQAASGHSAVARTAYAFGRDGFPRPLHPHLSLWRNPRPAHLGAAASTAAAAAAGITFIAVPLHHGPPPAGGASAGAGARPALGAAGQTPTPGAGGGTAVASATARASGMPTAGASSPPAGVTVPASSPAPVPASSPVSAPATATTSAPPGAGTLSVSPATLDVVPPASGAITLTASGGPVDWSISEAPGVAKKVTVAPMSGTLAAGASVTVTVTVTGPGHMHVHLTFSPDGATVTVIIS